MKNLIAVLALCVVSLGQATVLPKTTLFNKTTLFEAPPVPLAAYVAGCTGSNGPVSTIACAFSGNVTNGDAIACAGIWDTSLTFSTIAQSSGTATVGSFTEPNTTASNGTSRATQGYALVTGTGSATITLTVTGGTGNLEIMCHDISNAATSSPLDTSAMPVGGQGSPGTGANGVTTGNITTAVNGDYLFVWCWDIGGNSSTTAAGTGFTLRDQINVGGRETESQVQSSAGTVAGTFTATGGGADQWLVGIMAIKP